MTLCVYAGWSGRGALNGCVVSSPWKGDFARTEGLPPQPLPLATVNSALLIPCLFPRDKDGIQKAYQILVRLGLSPLEEDCVATHRICQIVSTRSASLCAATLAAVLWRIKENKGEERLRSTIGVDGSVYKKHPQ